MRKLTYTLDDNYIVPFLISAYSAIKCYPDGTLISILQPAADNSSMGLSHEGLEAVEGCLSILGIAYQIQYVDVQSFQEDNLPLWARFSPTTWLRYYFLFNSNFQERHVYYVEPDMLFLNSKFNLFDYPPREFSLTARVSPGHQDFENRWGSKIKNPWYFNCGVMVVDIDRWKLTIDQKEWWEVVSQFEALNFKVIDQDAINYVLRGRQDDLPAALNQYPSEYDRDSTSLIHFAGHHKPWVFKSNWLRRRLDQPTKDAMKLWDETFDTIALLLTVDQSLVTFFHKAMPKVKLSSKLTIAFPTLMKFVFKVRAIARNRAYS
jgi:lipopolysaccharide biosynthesis glycosyltransferase